MNYLSERQEIFTGMVEDKIRMQRRATENISINSLRRRGSWKKRISEEALLPVQKKFDL